MTLLKKTVAACAVALAGLAAVPSHAALTLGDIPGGTAVNDFLIGNFGPDTPIGSVEGWYGAQLYLAGGPAQITVDYFGAEAGFENSFLGFGGCGFSHDGPSDSNTITGGVVDSCVINNVASGLLTFAFTSPLGVATNGSNPDNTTNGVPNFFVSLTSTAGFGGLDNTLDMSTPGSGTIAWLFFDDGGGMRADGSFDDDNHDDMVVRLTITGGSVGIPEPGTIALLGAALLGMGAVRRRRLNA